MDFLVALGTDRNLFSVQPLEYGVDAYWFFRTSFANMANMVHFYLL